MGDIAYLIIEDITCELGVTDLDFFIPCWVPGARSPLFYIPATQELQG
jgi:hypothetical protein